MERAFASGCRVMDIVYVLINVLPSTVLPLRYTALEEVIIELIHGCDS